MRDCLHESVPAYHKLIVLVDVIDENPCLVMDSETASLRQLGDNFVDKEWCLNEGGCYRYNQPPFCYQSIGTPLPLEYTCIPLRWH